MTVRATWCLSNNVGDALTAWLVHRIAGTWPAYVPPAMEHLRRCMLVGSVLNHAQQDTFVAGAGVARLSDPVDARATFLSVRGPLSRQAVMASGGRCPEIYGDPAMLLPRWIPRATPTCPVGIVPHYTDHARSLTLWGGHIQDGRMKIVNVFAPVEEFVHGLTSCEVVLCSSLHGLVVAEASTRAMSYDRP